MNSLLKMPISSDPSCEIGAQLLIQEAQALQALADQLDDGFAQVVNLLSTITGRVIVTGIGKSGHIARKIAATLSSVGTPSYFVHPTEASHGDLGMITSQDAVLALSNSGETQELGDLISFTKRFQIPLIAITSKATSLLAENAQHVLLLANMPEACPLNLAPTTSTTMMLGLGDAIAMALLDKRGFSANDFKVFHPGGKIGSSLLKVSDIMHKKNELPLIQGDTSVSEAILTMTAKSFGSVGVVNTAGELIGIVTDGDLRRHMEDGLLSRKTHEIMNATPKTIRPSALAAEALGIMNQLKITSLFVTQENMPVGIIHIHDCLRAKVA